MYRKLLFTISDVEQRVATFLDDDTVSECMGIGVCVRKGVHHLSIAGAARKPVMDHELLVAKTRAKFRK